MTLHPHTARWRRSPLRTAVVSLGNGRYQIIDRGTNTALDGMSASTLGSSAAMWAPNNSPNNHWTIASV